MTFPVALIVSILAALGIVGSTWLTFTLIDRKAIGSSVLSALAAAALVYVLCSSLPTVLAEL